MISNVCKIEKGIKDLSKILKESEKVAVYANLDEKQTLLLRLICEELDGLLPNIVDDFNGKFWIEYEKGVCKVNAQINIENLNVEEKEELIKISTSKKNSAAKGIVGKIRDAIENLLLNENAKMALSSSGGYCLHEGYFGASAGTPFWSLSNYKSNAEENSEEWDELEKSIINNIADDVLVGVKGKCAHIIIVKNF
jgi:hypothetical protein